MKFIKNKKISNGVKIGMVILFAGLFFVFTLSFNPGQANVFDSISNFFKNLQTATSSKVAVEKEVPLYKPAIDYENAVIEAVEKAFPSVVSIVITKDLPVIQQNSYDPFSNLPPEFRELFGDRFQIPEPEQEPETEKREIGGGTGFIVSEDGMIVTNKHVVLDEEAEYTVLTNEGEKYNAEVLARDPVQDIAILKINAQGLKPAELGNSDSIKLGQTAIAIGNALGEFRNTVSVGVISGLSRSILASGAGFTELIENVIQTDAAINRGNSGGPLLNLKGEVIGINTAVAQDAQSIGFTIPINQVRRDIKSVNETGDIKVAFLGVRYRMITKEFAEEQNLSVEDGALVRGTDQGSAILPDSAAEQAGLKPEDIITKLNDEEVNLNQTLGYLIQKYQIGDTVSLTVLRNSEKLVLEATLAERPEL